LTSHARTTTDGVKEVLYSGKVPTWDGVPLDVDVAVPAGSCHIPLVSFGHGWGNSKTDWESDTVKSSDANKSGWNTTAMVAQGFAALTMSNRGWHGSCGPDASSNAQPSGLPAACTQNGRQYWIHLMDVRYEVRDEQWMIGRLVDAGLVDPARIVATGGSLGGGITWLLTLANDRVMCGGQGWDQANGRDPCAGKADGALVSWTTPTGRRLHVAAAVPEYTWASLISALVPNGRAHVLAAGTSSSLRTPIGVPIESYIAGLFADGSVLGNGFYQPATSTDTTSNLPAWFAAINAGPNSVSMQSPAYASEVNQALDQLSTYKSPLSDLLVPDSAVPVLQIQGFTDPLFKPVEAELMRAKVLAKTPRYPIATVFGDVGHSYASNPADVWAAFNARALQFVRYEVLRQGPAPIFDVEASLTRCAPANQADKLSFVSGASLGSLHTHELELTSSQSGVTSNGAAGPESAQSDPIANSGCRSLTAGTDSGVASWTWSAAKRDQVLVGTPKVGLDVSASGPDTEVIGRLWDVSADGTTQTLVARDVYRMTGITAGPPARIVFGLSANGWRLAAGDRWKLEITGSDAPTFQPDTVPSALAISSVQLTLPIL